MDHILTRIGSKPSSEFGANLALELKLAHVSNPVEGAAAHGENQNNYLEQIWIKIGSISQLARLFLENPAQDSDHVLQSKLDIYKVWNLLHNMIEIWSQLCS